VAMMQEMYCLSRRHTASLAGYQTVGMLSSAFAARSTGCVAGGFDVKRG